MPTVTDLRSTLAGASGSIVNSTKPFRDPLTSQRDFRPCTPASNTRASDFTARLIELNGMSAVKATPF